MYSKVKLYGNFKNTGFSKVWFLATKMVLTGTFVYTGFKVAFVTTAKLDTSLVNDWINTDTKRKFEYNEMQIKFFANEVMLNVTTTDEDV